MSDPFRLEGKTALVTGASRGLGEAIAVAYARAGADVGLVARNAEALEGTARLIEAYGRKAYVLPGDLSTPEGVRELASKALEASDRWDILVNNAGLGAAAEVLNTRLDEWDRVFTLNLTAPLLLCQLLLPQMIARGSGKIIHISSMASFLGTPGGAAYAASKAALNQLTRTMAVELGPKGINVNAICPTVVETEMGKKFWDDPARSDAKKAKLERIPMRRFAIPEDVAAAALYLAGPGSNFVNGVLLPLDGGLILAP